MTHDGRDSAISWTFPHLALGAIEAERPRRLPEPTSKPTNGGVEAFLGAALGALAAVLLIRRRGDRSPLGERRLSEPVSTSRRRDVCGELLDERYRLGRKIGCGGMGVVFEAEDVPLERRVADKRMRDELRFDPVERERFVREARILAGLKHPSLVEIHSIVEQGDDVYLVFEFVQGVTLQELLRDKCRLSLEETMKLIEPVAKALTFAHRRRVVHRNLKPGNVMLTDDGEVKVMDFGLARRTKDSSCFSQAPVRTFAGTPQYMAPEAENGIARKESDIYALAMMTYELLAGFPPYAPLAAAKFRHSSRLVPLSQAVPGLPRRLDDLMRAALEPDPDRRIPTAECFLARLKAIASERADHDTALVAVVDVEKDLEALRAVAEVRRADDLRPADGPQRHSTGGT